MRYFLLIFLVEVRSTRISFFSQSIQTYWGPFWNSYGLFFLPGKNQQLSPSPEPNGGFTCFLFFWVRLPLPFDDAKIPCLNVPWWSSKRSCKFKADQQATGHGGARLSGAGGAGLVLGFGNEVHVRGEKCMTLSNNERKFKKKWKDMKQGKQRKERKAKKERKEKLTPLS